MHECTYDSYCKLPWMEVVHPSQVPLYHHTLCTVTVRLGTGERCWTQCTQPDCDSTEYVVVKVEPVKGVQPPFTATCGKNHMCIHAY